MTRAPDVVVVGAGAIGAACALELAGRGASVEVLDAGHGWASGCSLGNAGLIVPSHAAPLATRSALREGLRWLGRADSPLSLQLTPALLPWLARFLIAAACDRASPATHVIRSLAVRSLEKWMALAPQQLERRGVLNVYASERGFEAGRDDAAAYGAAGLRCEVLDARATVALEPTLRGPIAGAVVFLDEAHGDPHALVTELGSAATALGARLRSGVVVHGLRAGGGVRTSVGDVPADRVVLAAGVATAALAPQLPVIAGRGCSVDVFDGLARPSLPVFLHEARVVATPLEGRTRLAGTLQLTAARAGGLDPRRVAGVVASGRRGLAASGTWSAAVPWVGARPCAPDGLPIVGRLRDRPDVVVATAHAMLGLTLAPVTGQLVADALDGKPALPQLAPDRFHAARRTLVAV